MPLLAPELLRVQGGGQPPASPSAVGQGLVLPLNTALAPSLLPKGLQGSVGWVLPGLGGSSSSASRSLA